MNPAQNLWTKMNSVFNSDIVTLYIFLSLQYVLPKLLNHMPERITPSPLREQRLRSLITLLSELPPDGKGITSNELREFLLPTLSLYSAKNELSFLMRAVEPILSRRGLQTIFINHGRKGSSYRITHCGPASQESRLTPEEIQPDVFDPPPYQEIFSPEAKRRDTIWDIATQRVLNGCTTGTLTEIPHDALTLARQIFHDIPEKERPKRLLAGVTASPEEARQKAVYEIVARIARSNHDQTVKTRMIESVCDHFNVSIPSRDPQKPAPIWSAVFFK